MEDKKRWGKLVSARQGKECGYRAPSRLLYETATENLSADEMGAGFFLGRLPPDLAEKLNRYIKGNR